MSGYTVGNKAFDFYNEAVAYCESVDFDPEVMIEEIKPVITAKMVSEAHGLKTLWDDSINVSYIVETTQNDEDVHIDFENIYKKECATLGEAIWIVCEWQKVGYNNINVMTQVKRDGETIIEDTANDVYFTSPEDSRFQKWNRELVEISDVLTEENMVYKEFVKKYRSEKLFDEFVKDRNVFNVEDGLYWYAYRLRGFSIGCQPKGHIDVRHDVGRHGIVGYERELTDKEMSEFELVRYDFGKVVTL